MTDLSSLPEEMLKTPRSSCLKKKLICGFFILFLAGGLALAYFFCPYLNPKQGEGAEELGQLREAMVTLNSKVEALNTRLNNIEMKSDSELAGQRAPLSPAPSSPNVTNLQNDLATLTSTVSTLEAEVKQNSNHSLHTAASLSAAIAFIQLREMAMSDAGFSHELKIMENAAKSDNGFQEHLDKLEPFAEKGAPTIAQLHDQLLTLEAPTFQALDRSEAATWWERLIAELKSLVSIRRIHGENTRDIFSPLETNIAKGDIEAALAAMSMLPPEARNSLNDWRERAVARQKINQALEAIADHFNLLTNGVPTEREP